MGKKQNGVSTPPQNKTYSPQEAIRIALERHYPNIIQACSFQAEAIVILDMSFKIREDIKLFALDTGRLNEETYEVAEQVRRRYGDIVRWMFPDRDEVEKLEREKGLYSFRRSVENRKECCYIRKVEPMQRALQGMTAWIAGLRRDQSVTRSNVQQFETDYGHGGIVKVNPLIEWTTEDVWNYIHEHELPYNRLYKQGYHQIGCACCTRAVLPGEHPRAGRWWWESAEHKECGIHIGGSGI
jgi:phosphoadenosine phosphosulfate reductase